MGAATVLRMGRLAKFSAPQVIQCFHQIVRANGSPAYWVQAEGLLAAADPTELDKQLPYHEWVRQAFRENAE